jgi:hypothetical protein
LLVYFLTLYIFRFIARFTALLSARYSHVSGISVNRSSDR